MNEITYPKGTTKEQWDRYYEDMDRWKAIYDPIKPKEDDFPNYQAYRLAFDKWCFDSAMSEPNKPGYYRANND